jgi:hypothetical protein
MVKEHLPIQVGNVNDVLVNQDELANTEAGQAKSDRAAKATRA